jgi:hypothetical protein
MKLVSFFLAENKIKSRPIHLFSLHCMVIQGVGLTTTERVAIVKLGVVTVSSSAVKLRDRDLMQTSHLSDLGISPLQGISSQLQHFASIAVGL